MSLASEILVVILSVFLAVFLILGIMLFIYLIKLTQQIRRITKTAEHTVKGIDSLISNFSRFSSPLSTVSFIAKYAKKFMKKKKV